MGTKLSLMSFVETLDNLALTKSELVQRFEDLISPKSDHELEAMAQASRSLTLQNIRSTMRLFATLSLSGCAERGYAAWSRRLGIGALIGLSLWQDEAIALAAHLEYLFRHCWQAQITVSFPRLRPAAGGFRPLFSITDRELAQLVCALRIVFPQLGIVLSTRECASLRDSLAQIGVTMMSAGSHTEPGGYTG